MGEGAQGEGRMGGCDKSVLLLYFKDTQMRSRVCHIGGGGCHFVNNFIGLIVGTDSVQ